ncbi:TlpA family protein disulfide reductase [Flavobacterium sp. F-380]|uniref:TlpA family protein disulfide reductase n=1 Tax=Flavobacterium kayseriense TaxID=2764714 RepID=A0ABR7JAY1_9FLAO|nr:TlpA disulfide reductase family protein [Flavobacterium kayseriense]MBC5842697.1 TlpA family protein disulfide reductase [Flavobacterium kayseriense]MBC5849227.1 TlpA family protein disulfide reductase [Flavobacterium kayseriense]MBU0941192.1 TlpA family protein disulfide reductase [Bacteroidota bacterium]
MKKTIILLLAVLGISCSKTKDQKTEFSEKALAETLLAPDGSQVAFQNIIEQHKGKTVVIEVWASWCADCIKAMPKLKELQANNPDVDYVFISMDKAADKWKTGIEKHALMGDHYMANDQMEGVFAKAIDLDWIPRYIILDKTGKVVLYRAIETDFDLINETLNDLK